MSDLVADMSIVDRETIEAAGAAGVADVLSRLPGVQMVRNGGLGSNSSVYLRGVDNRFTAVYIDGVRVDSQSTGGASWQDIPWRPLTASKCCVARQQPFMARMRLAA